MVVHDRGRAGGVPGGHGRMQGAVVVHHGLQAAAIILAQDGVGGGAAHHLAARHANGPSGLLQQAPQMPVAAGIQQDEVELAVEPLQGVEIAGVEGVLRGRDVGGEFRQQGGAAIGGGLLGDQRLQRGAAAVEAEDLPGGERVNPEAHRILRIERAILHQFSQRLAHRGAADAQPGCPVAILQAGAGGQLAVDQGGPETFVDLRMQWGALADGRGGCGDGRR